MLLDDAFAENKYYILQVNIWLVGEDDLFRAKVFSATLELVEESSSSSALEVFAGL